MRERLRHQGCRKYGRRGGWSALLLASLFVAAVWMLVLPRIGEHPALRGPIDRRDALGINADAMFYTELEAMETLVIKRRSSGRLDQ